MSRNKNHYKRYKRVKKNSMIKHEYINLSLDEIINQLSDISITH